MPVPAQNDKMDKGSIAILRDDIPVAGAASSPEYLASVLGESGYEVRFVSAMDLCDERLMRKDNFGVLVLPYGASYPAMGKDALISYLKGGGSFLSIGGYAFDNLLIRSNGEWKPLPDGGASPLSKPQIPPNPPLEKGGMKIWVRLRNSDGGEQDSLPFRHPHQRVEHPLLRIVMPTHNDRAPKIRLHLLLPESMGATASSA